MNYKHMAFALGTATLALCAGCERGGEDTEVTPGTAQCDSTTMQGTLSLSITGVPGDSFRISYLCGGQQVTQCTATIAAGATTATCSAGPTPVPNGGVRTCPVGPSNTNSAQAAVRSSGCG